MLQSGRDPNYVYRSNAEMPAYMRKNAFEPKAAVPVYVPDRTFYVRGDPAALDAIERDRLELKARILADDLNDRRAALVFCFLLVIVAAFLVGWLVNIG